MWNGKFVKHRDWLHNSYWDHCMDSGGSWTFAPEGQRTAKVKYDPIDAGLIQPSDRYYFVDVDLGHDQKVYTFLIPTEPDQSEPEEERIRENFDAQLSHPVPGGRDWWDYLDFEDEETLNNRRVAKRLEEGERPRYGPPPAQPHAPVSFWDSTFA